MITAVAEDLRGTAGDQAVLLRAAVGVAVPPAEQLARQVTGLLVTVAVALDVQGPGSGAGVREIEAGEAAVVVEEAEVGPERGAQAGEAALRVVLAGEAVLVLVLAGEAAEGVELAAGGGDAAVGVLADGGLEGAVAAVGEIVEGAVAVVEGDDAAGGVRRDGS